MRLGLVSLALSLLLQAAPAFGQGLADEPSPTGGPPPWAYSMAHDLMSPFCPGRTLAACPSPQADQLRQWILFQAAAGQTRGQIEESLFARFGDVMLSQPKTDTGWGVSAYVIPIAGFFVGLGLVGFFISRLARGGGNAAQTEASATPIPVKPVGASTGPGMSDAELERLVDEELAAS